MVFDPRKQKILERSFKNNINICKMNRNQGHDRLSLTPGNLASTNFRPTFINLFNFLRSWVVCTSFLATEKRDPLT